MINPYATSFMIAARQDYHAKPRLTAVSEPKPGKQPFRLFARKKDTEAPCS